MGVLEMDMRNLNNLNINKVILHILNSKEDKVFLNDFELDLLPQLNDLFRKHIKNSINDESTRIAKFQNEINVVREHSQRILDNPEKNFIPSSKEIAKYLYESMKSNPNISSANFVVCLYSTDEGTFIALLKMDFSEIIETEVQTVGDKTKINVLVKGAGIPNDKQRLQKCVFYKNYNAADDYDIILLDKQALKSNKHDLIAEFFVSNFLHCELAKTSRDATRNFKAQTERFIARNFSDDVEKQDELRNLLVSTLKTSDNVNVISFAETAFGNNDALKDKYKELISEKIGDFTFEIDKNWVRDNIKRKKYKTNTGVEINIDVETSSNPDKFRIIKNDDETYDITIKNIEKFSEKII
jgi:hypothetical protein